MSSSVTLTSKWPHCHSQHFTVSALSCIGQVLNAEGHDSIFLFIFSPWGRGRGSFVFCRGWSGEGGRNWPKWYFPLTLRSDCVDMWTWFISNSSLPSQYPLCSNVTGKVRFSSCAVMPWHTLLPVPSTFDRDDGNEKDIKKINGGANYCNTLDFIVVNLVGVYIYTNGIFIYSKSTYSTTCTNQESVYVFCHVQLCIKLLTQRYI